MLLENPRLRFSEDELYVKRRAARYATQHRLEDKGEYRDDGYGKATIKDRIRTRKIAAARIAALHKLKLDELAHAGEMLAILNSSYGISLTTVDRMEMEKYGFHMRATVIQNHKSTWMQPVWANESWFRDSPYCFYHDVHQSEDDPTQVAYNRTVDNIRRNIQTRTRPGKYLTQFFSNVLSPAQIKVWAERQVAVATCVSELKFIENDNPDGWVDVYANGPQSCMRGMDAVRVYAHEGNGLRLAYLESNKEIVARCIVVDATNDDEVKGWIRIYAREQRWDTSMKSMLAAAGYEEQTNLNGVKVQLIEARSGGFVCPYIDRGDGGEQSVSVDESGGFMLIGGGDFDAAVTGGTVNGGETCDNCQEDGFSEDDMTYVESTEERVCQHCLDHHYTYAYGRRYQDYFPEGDCIYCESDGEWYHQDAYADRDIVYLEDRDAYYHIDDCVCCDVGTHEGEWVHVDDMDTDHVSGEVAHEGEFQQIDGKSVHESYVVSCYVSGDDVDMRECVEIKLHTKHLYPHSSFYSKVVNLYIHQDNLTAEVILSDFVQCGDLLLTSFYYGNPVTCCTHSNLEYGSEYTGDRIEDVLVADAEERVANAEVREIFSMAA